jgi:hypothetical protein
MEATGGPPGRHFHSAVLYEGCMYIFGGTSNGFYNDLHCFNLGMALPAFIAVGVRRDVTKPVRVISPFAHVILFINTETGTWSLVTPATTAPSPRYGHSAVAYRHCMYIYGGYDKVHQSN